MKLPPSSPAPSGTAPDAVPWYASVRPRVAVRDHRGDVELPRSTSPRVVRASGEVACQARLKGAGRAGEMWALQRTAARFLRGIWRSLEHCCRTPLPADVQDATDHHVTLSSTRDGALARIHGVQTCGVVAACPVCAARETAERTHVVMHYAQQAQTRRDAYMVGGLLTVDHHQGDDWAETLQRVQGAWSEMWRSGSLRAAVEDLGLVGVYRATEATTGRHGMHPHIHWLAWMRAPEGLDRAGRQERAEALGDLLWGRWSSAHPRAVREGQGAYLVESPEAAARYAAKGLLAVSDEEREVYTERVRQQTRGALLDAAAPAGAKAGHGPTYWLRRLTDDPTDEVAARDLRRYAGAVKGRRMAGWIWRRRLDAWLGEPAEYDPEQHGDGQDDAEEDAPRVSVRVAAGDWLHITRIAWDGYVRAWAACPSRLAEWQLTRLDVVRTVAEWRERQGWRDDTDTGGAIPDPQGCPLARGRPARVYRLSPIYDGS